jgi:phage terminase Nu1 subunit (DNA packaging protein)
MEGPFLRPDNLSGEEVYKATGRITQVILAGVFLPIAAGGRSLPGMIEGTITAEGLAALTGFSVRWISKLARDGTVPAPKAGQYPAEETIRKLFAYLRQATEGIDEKLSTQRARLTASKADMAEMQRARMAGEMLPRSQWVAAGTAIAAGVTAKILAVPPKLAARLAITGKPADVEKILREALEEALENITRLAIVPSNAGQLSGGRKRRQDHLGDVQGAAEDDGLGVG